MQFIQKGYVMQEYIKRAEFISLGEEAGKNCPVFRKKFVISKPFESACLQITALGVYVAEINGKRVGDAVLTPGWTEYEKRLQYFTYDISGYLSSENVIEIGLGHGWYASRIGSVGVYKGAYAEFPSLAAAISVRYTDGTETLIVTGTDWEAAKSGVLFSGIYDGERTDARIVPQYGEKIIVTEYGKDKLVPAEGEYIKETERISPKEILITPKGETVIDFGQNLTGYVEFTVTGNAGTKVTIGHAEVLDKYGNFYTENYRSAEARAEYTLKDGRQTYKPRYTFYGFRYIRLNGWPEKINADNFTAIVVHSDMKRAGWFECGHAKLNKLYENVIWGQRGNFLDVPTDCPQRDERLGWTGDAEVFCRTACLNYDTEKFFVKWLHDLSLAQKEDGMIPRVVPDVFRTNGRGEFGSAAWGDAATVCPYEIYLAYGNKEILAEMFPTMKKWVDYITGKSENYLWKNSPHFGDWLGLDAPAGSYKGSTSEELIATAYYFLSCGLLVKAGNVLGYDVSHYKELAEKIRKAFNAEYVRDGYRLSSDTQTAYVLAIHFGLVDEKEQFAKRLVELIEEAGDTLRTGFVGTPYLLDALTETGHADKAYTLLLQEKFPSWLYSVNRGATTIWEHWDGVNEEGDMWSKDMNSFNHYAYGSVAQWMYRTVAGIKTDENHPGYKHIIISPIPNSKLGFVKCRLNTRSGQISSEWTAEQDGTVRYSFEIPQGVTATLIIGGKKESVGAGRYTRYGKI